MGREKEPMMTVEREPVASTGKAWLKRREKLRAESFIDEREVFGSALVRAWNAKEGLMAKELRAPPAVAEHMRTTAERAFPHIVKQAQAEMRKLAGMNRKELAYELANYLTSGVEVPGVSERLRPRDADLFAYALMGSMSRGDKMGRAFLKPEVLIPFFQYHAGLFRKREAELLPQLERLRGDVKKKLVKMAKDGALPLEPAVAAERVDAANITIVDDLTATLLERWGDYEDRMHRIRLSASVPERFRRSVLTHEFLHALSGQFEFIERITYSDSDEEEGYEDGGRPESYKVGLHFSEPMSAEGELADADRRPSLRWLNEGLTEDLNDEVTKQAFAYAHERTLVQMLVGNGVPRKLLYEAYFENYRPTDAGKGHRLPKTRELFAETGRLFGRGFLVRLDRFIRMRGGGHEGAAAAVVEWQERGKRLNAFLRDVFNEKPERKRVPLRKAKKAA